MKNTLAVFEDFKIRRVYDEKAELIFTALAECPQEK